MIPLESLKKCEIFSSLKDYELEVIGEIAKPAAVISSRLRNLNQKMVNIQ